MKRRIITIAITVLALAALLATGCTDGPVTSGTSTEGESNFRLLISDEKNDIGDFESLEVTISEIGVKPSDNNSQWETYTFEPKTVDLTKLIGDNATEVFNGDIPAGDYNKVFIYVDNVTGNLTGAVPTTVKLPSGKLHISKPFTVGENATVDFVFDITVIKAGKSGKYILKPQIVESGPNQNYTEVDPQGKIKKIKENHQEQNQQPGQHEGQQQAKNGKSGDELQLQVEGEATLGAEVTLTVITEDDTPVAGATVTVNGVALASKTDSSGQLVITLPNTPGDVKIKAKLKDKRGELELELEAEE